MPYDITIKEFTCDRCKKVADPAVSHNHCILCEECVESWNEMCGRTNASAKSKPVKNLRTIWYHGTSEELWDAIQKEQILFGERHTEDPELSPDRCTYLADTQEEAACYGDVVLQVGYDPTVHPKKNNYVENCWQMRVYEPIPLSDCKRIQ
ncbi:MAG: hypothetical protein F6K48_03120 [Okeania sp. SIO3H1]|nr:hypothetical protein [Okeania sp. SIO3H1]